MFKHDVKELRLRARNQWFSILTANGIDARCLRNVNGPCPICGGKDRWRWDNKNGNGGGYCHQCSASGDGFRVLATFLGLEGHKNLPELLERVAESIGIACNAPPADCLERAAQQRERNRKAAEQIWKSASPIQNSEVQKYLNWRGLKVPRACENLRVATIHSFSTDKPQGRFPAMIARVEDKLGSFLGIHRTYLVHSVNSDAFEYWKMLLGSVAGGAIRLGSLSDSIHLAEGIETALAVKEMFAYESVWAAISRTMLERIELPAVVKSVTIWADRDLNRSGEISAHALANRLHSQGISVRIRLPSENSLTPLSSIDWLDVYNAREGKSHV